MGGGVRVRMVLSSRRESCSTAVGRVSPFQILIHRQADPSPRALAPCQQRLTFNSRAWGDATIGLFQGLRSDWWVSVSFPRFSGTRETPRKSHPPATPGIRMKGSD